MGEDRPHDLLVVPETAEDFGTGEGMLLDGWMLFVVEIVKETDEFPFFDVFVEFFCEVSHGRFDGQGVLYQTGIFGVLIEELPRFFSCFHGSLDSETRNSRASAGRREWTNGTNSVIIAFVGVM